MTYPELVMDERLTNSQLNEAKTCPRKLLFAYVLGIRLREDKAELRIGQMFHKGLDLKSKGKNLAEITDEIITAYGDERLQDYELEIEIVLRLLEGYIWRWAKMDSEIEVVASELKFEIPITNPESGRASRTWVACGKIDKIISLNGMLMVMEHKTTKDDISPESNYWRHLRIDSQISLYFIAAKSLGYDVSHVLYDVIRKPGIRPKLVTDVDENEIAIVVDAEGNRVLKKDGSPRTTGDKEKGYIVQNHIETPAEYGSRLMKDIYERYDTYYFDRRNIARLQDDLVEYQLDLWDWAKIIRDCFNNKRFPKNDRACIGFGTCKYFDLCTGDFNPGKFDLSTLPEQYMVVEDVHQELAE